MKKLFVALSLTLMALPAFSIDASALSPREIAARKALASRTSSLANRTRAVTVPSPTPSIPTAVSGYGVDAGDLAALQAAQAAAAAPAPAAAPSVTAPTTE